MALYLFVLMEVYGGGREPRLYCTLLGSAVYFILFKFTVAMVFMTNRKHLKLKFELPSLGNLIVL